RVRRIGLLRDDELAELRGDVDVRVLERAADDCTARRIVRRTRLRRGREGAAVERLQRVLAVEGRERDFRQGNNLPVGESADHAVLAVDRNRLELAGGEAVLLPLAHLRRRARLRKFGEAVVAELELDVAQRIPVHGQVLQRHAGQGRSEFTARIERKRRADVLPRRLRSGGAGVALIEQLPGIGAAARGAADLGPAKVDVHGIAVGVVGGEGTAVDRFAVEGREIVADHPAAGGGDRRIYDAEVGGGRGAADGDIGRGVRRRQVYVASRVDGADHAGEVLHRRLQLSERRDVAGTGPERDGLRGAAADRDGQRLTRSHRALRQQVGRRE